MYFRTSSGAIYSRTVPLGDSNEYFDQIWFPSEPPGVALRGPLCCGCTSRESAQKPALHETVHDPQIILNSAAFSALTEFPPPSLVFSFAAGLCGGRISSPAKGKVNLWGEILLLLLLTLLLPPNTAALSLQWCQQVQLYPLSNSTSVS